MFERRSGRSALTRAFTVYAPTLEQLDARGMADELVASGTPVAELRLFASAALGLSRLPSRFPYLLVTPHYQTERVLEERARRVGADIRHGSEVTELTQHSPLPGSPFLSKRLAGAISGVGISYPAPPGAHPLAGKRVGDLPLADGRRLYEALRGGRFLLAAIISR